MQAVASRLARRRRWQALDRAKRRLAKRCRDCGNPAPTDVLCTTCYEKQYRRRPWLLLLLNARKAELQQYLHPASRDRRRNGKVYQDTAWVLHPSLQESHHAETESDSDDHGHD